MAGRIAALTETNRGYDHANYSDHLCSNPGYCSLAGPQEPRLIPQVGAQHIRENKVTMMNYIMILYSLVLGLGLYQERANSKRKNSAETEDSKPCGC